MVPLCVPQVTDKVGDDTTHLVAARLGTAKVNQIRGSKKLESRIHLVTPNWLWDCAERWEKVSVSILKTKLPTMSIHSIMSFS